MDGELTTGSWSHKTELITDLKEERYAEQRNYQGRKWVAHKNTSGWLNKA
jgi:hypothetical protein